MAYAKSNYYTVIAGHCAEMEWYFLHLHIHRWHQNVVSTADYDFGFYGDPAVVRIDDASW